MSVERKHPQFEAIYGNFLKAAEALRSGQITPADFALQQTESLIGSMNTDHRTGLLNSEGLRYMLEAAIGHALAGNKPLSVIYIDGNQFKRINDTLGHHVGDRVIVSMANALDILHKESLFAAHLTDYSDRPPAIISSQSNEGGDEFVVICFENLHTAIKLAKYLKMFIRDHVHHDVPELLVNIPEGFSISTGTAELTKSREKQAKENAAQLIERAEKRMYEEKWAEKGWKNKALHIPTHVRDLVIDGITRIHNIRGGH